METKSLAKETSKSVYNSTCLHLDRFKIKTDKKQVDESLLVAHIRDKLSSLEYEQKSDIKISEESVAESEMLLI